MVHYPIQVRRKHYAGHNQSKLQEAVWFNNDAARLEDHINFQIRNGKTGAFFYATIAKEVGIPVERVRDILFSLDCGYHGFTVANG